MPDTNGTAQERELPREELMKLAHAIIAEVSSAPDDARLGWTEAGVLDLARGTLALLGAAPSHEAQRLAHNLLREIEGRAPDARLSWIEAGAHDLARAVLEGAAPPGEPVRRHLSDDDERRLLALLDDLGNAEVNVAAGFHLRSDRIRTDADLNRSCANRDEAAGRIIALVRELLAGAAPAEREGREAQGAVACKRLDRLQLEIERRLLYGTAGDGPALLDEVWATFDGIRAALAAAPREQERVVESVQSSTMLVTGAAAAPVAREQPPEARDPFGRSFSRRQSRNLARTPEPPAPANYKPTIGGGKPDSSEPPAPGETRETERHGWTVHHGVTCVECPGCGFTFDADHEDTDGGYSCPCCKPAEWDDGFIRAVPTGETREIVVDTLPSRAARTTIDSAAPTDEPARLAGRIMEGVALAREASPNPHVAFVAIDDCIAAARLLRGERAET